MSLGFGRVCAGRYKRSCCSEKSLVRRMADSGADEEWQPCQQCLFFIEPSRRSHEPTAGRSFLYDEAGTVQKIPRITGRAGGRLKRPLDPIFTGTSCGRNGGEEVSSEQTDWYASCPTGRGG